MTPAEILASATNRAFWQAQAPLLHIEATEDVSWPAGAPDGTLREQLWREGWVELPRALPIDVVDALANQIQRFHETDVPTPCVFMFDEPWHVATHLAKGMSELMAAEARVLPDVWAWFVPASAGAHGWTPHRGVATDVRDARGAPTLINVWAALSDVTEASSCMHVVPLPRDEHYPDALERTDFPVHGDFALPVASGSVLVWNANVLHHGGQMMPGGKARVSLSFSFDSSGSRGALDAIPPPFAERVDLIADMLVTYREASGTEGPWLEWAQLWRGMREMRRRPCYGAGAT